MKKSVKTNVSIFVRTFVLTLMILMLPTSVIYAATVADSKTRQIGYNDSSPSVELIEIDGGYEFLFFGYTTQISKNVVNAVTSVADYVKKIIPAPIRTAAGIIKSSVVASQYVVEIADEQS